MFVVLVLGKDYSNHRYFLLIPCIPGPWWVSSTPSGTRKVALVRGGDRFSLDTYLDTYRLSSGLCLLDPVSARRLFASQSVQESPTSRNQRTASRVSSSVSALAANFGAFCHLSACVPSDPCAYCGLDGRFQLRQSPTPTWTQKLIMPLDINLINGAVVTYISAGDP